MSVDAILDKAARGERVSEAEAEELLAGHELLELGRAADLVRERMAPGDDVTFVVDRNINYTNICITGCEFCAFHRRHGAEGAYLLTNDEIFGKIEETIELGGTGIMMQGGLHPRLDIDYYCGLLQAIKERFDIYIHSFSPPEISHIARLSRLTLEETLTRMKESGLDSLPGGGAEILVDGVRQRVSPKKIGADEWMAVMEAAHGCGLRSTATMMFGSVESHTDRVEHMRRLRELQDRTGGFRAFIPWSFQPANTAMEGTPPASGFDYLKTLAVSRIYLDNIDNIQASWVTQGLKVAQVALSFGANDLGSTMIEENVVAAAGVTYRISQEELVRAIEATGKHAVQRRHDYSPVSA